MKESPSPFEEGNTILRGDKDHPFKGGGLQVTPEEFAGIKGFIRELRPGVYVKCSQCHKMRYGSTFTVSLDDVYCEECS